MLFCWGLVPRLDGAGAVIANGQDESNIMEVAFNRRFDIAGVIGVVPGPRMTQNAEIYEPYMCLPRLGIVILHSSIHYISIRRRPETDFYHYFSSRFVKSCSKVVAYSGALYVHHS